jgi:hypothetical protein
MRWDYSSINRKEAESPRLSIRWHLTKNLAFAANWGIYYQYPDILYDGAQYDGSNYQYMMENLPPQRMRYLATGINYKVKQNWRFTMEAYLKRYQDLPQYHNDQYKLANNYESRSYGIESGITYEGNQSTFWLNYTYSRIKSYDIFYAIHLPDAHDQPHWATLGWQRNLVGPWQLFTVVRAGSGYAQDAGGVWMRGWSRTSLDYYRNQDIIRFPYFRWDMRISYSKRNWTAYFEMINLTNHRNFDRFIDTGYMSNSEGSYIIERHQLYMMPFMPNFGFSVRF